MTPGLPIWVLSALGGIGLAAAMGAFWARRRSTGLATALLACAIASFIAVLVHLSFLWMVRQAAGAEAYNDARWIFTSPWPAAVRISLALCCGVGVYLGWRSGRGLGWKRRATLTVIRATGLTLLAFMMLGPSLELRYVMSQHGHVAVVVDGSQSMALANGTQTRWAQAMEVLARSHGLLARLGNDYEVRWYVLGRNLRLTSQPDLAAENPDRASTDNAQTDLGGALVQLSQAALDGTLAGVVLVSDGIDTGTASPGDVAVAIDHLVRANVAIHTVGIGAALRDVALGPIDAAPFGYVRTASGLRAPLTCRGFAPRAVTATLVINGHATRRKQLEACSAAASATTDVAFEYAPDQVGPMVAEIVIDPLPGEASLANNRAASVISVVRDKVRILHVAGAPTWDVRALRQQLRNNPNVELVAFYVLRRADDVGPATDEELSLIAFPSAELFTEILPSFDLIVLQNFDYRTDDLGDYLEKLATYVDRGGGMVVLGGDQAYGGAGPGAYAGTPLAEVLPFELAAAPAPATRDERAFWPQLTAAGELHPAVRIVADRARNRQLWQRLVTLQGSNVVGDLVGGATALVVHPSRRTPKGQPMPMVAVREVGAGRVLAVATDALWRLWFEGSDSEASTGRDYQLLIEAALQWAMRDDGGRMIALTAPEKIAGGAPGPTVVATLRTAAGQPLPHTPLQLTVVQLGDAGAAPPQTLALTSNAQGLASVTLGAAQDVPNLGPGAYLLTASATIAGLPQTTTRRMYVTPPPDERANPTANFEWLARLSRDTGGVALVEPVALPMELQFAKPRLARVAAAIDVPIWNHPMVFAAMVALLLTEWILRRRGGYL